MKKDAVWEDVRCASLFFRYSPELELPTALLWAGTKAWISWKWEHGGVCKAMLIYTVEKREINGTYWGIVWETWS